jgi:hypothetical protein
VEIGFWMKEPLHSQPDNNGAKEREYNRHAAQPRQRPSVKVSRVMWCGDPVASVRKVPNNLCGDECKQQCANKCPEIDQSQVCEPPTLTKLA